MPETTSRCWVITDGAAGNERQALALAQRVTSDVRVWQLELRPPWSWCAPHLLAGARAALAPAQRAQFAPPWPALAIGCGRSAALLTRGLRRWSGGHTFTVQILDPRIDPAEYDLVIAPQHDTLHGANVLTPLGSLNPIDDAWLTDGAAAFNEFAALPAPRRGILIGASHREIAIDTRYCIRLIEAFAKQYERQGGSFLVTTSRRTPAALGDFLRSAFARFPGVFWSGPQDGPNPYAGVLAHAQSLFVTPDSVNMLSEACAVGIPVATWWPAPARGKLGRFHSALREAGHLRLLGDPIGPPPAAPLRETAAVAALVTQRWHERQALMSREIA